MSDQRNVYQRINAVRETNEYIKKAKEVDGKYMVVTHDEVTAKVRPDLIKNGVVIEPYLTESRTVQESGMKTGKGVPIVRFESVWDVHFVNVDDPKDRATLRVPAHALDTGDKGPGKACSYAVKMAMLKMFSIETGEEDEERRERDATGDSITVKQYAEFEKQINDLELAPSLPDDAQKIWERIHAICAEAKDTASPTRLRALLTTKVSTLKKKGAAGAATAKH